jgi:mono/diheme cytochrome c family protein
MTARPRLIAIAVLALLAVVVAGCGAVNHIPSKMFTSPNEAVGKTLFMQKCGACHTLADAATTGTIGPNLDDSFAPDYAQGFHQSTIADVVRGQIAYPDTNPGTGTHAAPNPGMTANLLHGQQARDVAIYVAMCASKPHCGVTAASASTAAATEH